MESNASRVEAERLLGISEKLLQSRDLNGSRDFAVLAQETEPLLDGSDQIIAIVDVLIAGDRRINNHHDWYAILQVDPTQSSSDADLIKRHYRRLALLLHPDKNRFPFADNAFRLVSQAWSLLSDSAKKPLYDREHTLYSKVDLASSSKLPVRRSSAAAAADSFSLSRTFWTLCPYCYVLFEYPRVYEECCLKCQKCGKAFHAAAVDNLPPIVPGQEAYNCCWAVFPMGFVVGNLSTTGGGKQAEGVSPGAPGFPNWMPPFFDAGAEKIRSTKPVKKTAAAAPPPSPPPPVAAPVTGSKKRGRPRLH